MKRISLFAVTGLLLFLFTASVASAFGVKDVLKMNRDEIPDSLIILKIENSGKTFHLSADDMRALHDAGVSDEVISALLRTEGRDRDYGSGDYYYPYSYPYYSYPYGHVFLGFGYRHYYSPYYGGYRVPRYRSYYSNPGSGNYGNQRYRGSYGTRPPSAGTGSQYRPSRPSTGTQSRRR
jgi:hypothetical protein